MWGCTHFKYNNTSNQLHSNWDDPKDCAFDFVNNLYSGQANQKQKRWQKGLVSLIERNQKRKDLECIQRTLLRNNARNHQEVKEYDKKRDYNLQSYLDSRTHLFSWGCLQLHQSTWGGYQSSGFKTWQKDKNHQWKRGPNCGTWKRISNNKKL